jgi:hypothetical protein
MDYLRSVGDPATDLPFGDTAANLRSAVAGETYEYTNISGARRSPARRPDDVADCRDPGAPAIRAAASPAASGLEGTNDPPTSCRSASTRRRAELRSQRCPARTPGSRWVRTRRWCSRRRDGVYQTERVSDPTGRRRGRSARPCPVAGRRELATTLFISTPTAGAIALASWSESRASAPGVRGELRTAFRPTEPTGTGSAVQFVRIRSSRPISMRCAPAPHAGRLDHPLPPRRRSGALAARLAATEPGGGAAIPIDDFEGVA